MRVLTQAEVDSILDRVENGHRDAFRLIVREFSLPLRSFLASQLHHHDDVDDMTQDVFIAAYRDLTTFRRGSDFGAWLRGIARNKLLDHFRSTSRRERALDRFRQEIGRLVEHDLETAALTQNAETIEALLHCISRLPEKLRRVVRAGLEGDKPAELAKQYVTTVGAIYNLHYRANQLLRECVQKGMG